MERHSGSPPPITINSGERVGDRLASAGEDPHHLQARLMVLDEEPAARISTSS